MMIFKSKSKAKNLVQSNELLTSMEGKLEFEMSNHQMVNNLEQSKDGTGIHDFLEKNFDEKQKFGLMLKEQAIIKKLLRRMETLEHKIEKKIVT